MNLVDLLRRRVLVLDGAMGTRLQTEILGPEDFGGPGYEGCNEALVLTRPDLIGRVHREYFEAGADIAETGTFGATPLVLAEYGLESRAREINRQAAFLARQAALDCSTPERPRFVAGSMGPTTRSLLLTGGVTFEAMAASYAEQARGLIEGGVDFLLIETCIDPLNVKAAFTGIDAVLAEMKCQVPVAVSLTVEPSGVTLGGLSAEAFYVSLEHRSLLYIGLNCAIGPEFMADPLRSLAGIAECPVACVPNAGLPDENGLYRESPEHMAAVLQRFLAAGWLNLIGGCCGTTAAHIKAFAELAPQFSPRMPQAKRWGRVSGIEYQTLDEDRRPLQVGERTNVIGSRKFKQLIHQGAFEQAADIGRAQVAKGAHILDVCLADPDRNEAEDMQHLIRALVRAVRVPLMIDSTDRTVIETALKLVPGKPIINSVNLEDGEARFHQVVPLARSYGAALVVGCIDEDPVQGMALTAERKLAIARRSHALLTEKYGVPETDLIFDALVFPCASGDANYRGSARETIEGVRRIKQAFPGCKTLLGISNVSFGLPPAAREVLNAVFLHECVEAGLDLAIVNSEKLVRYATIPEDQRQAALDLLDHRGDDPPGRFAALFRETKASPQPDTRAIEPIETRLVRRIAEARRDGLEEDLEEALSRYLPLDLINGPLLDGMGEVGRLFAANQLIVAEVLQSAEVMKAAVSYLEPFMEPGSGPKKGRFVLATVKGDVHDIGKNLVGILLANNGFQVIDLGIKVDPVTLARAIQEHKPALVGLSGLLVKSAQQMAVTAADLKSFGIDVPILVGGAALSRRFTQTRILPQYDGPVLYARDAMEGLDLANRLVDPGSRAALEQDVGVLRAAVAAGDDGPIRDEPAGAESSFSGRSVLPAPDVPVPPDFEPHQIELSGKELLGWINEQMLFGRHLGLRGNVRRAAERGDEKYLRLKEQVEAAVDEGQVEGWLRPKGIWRFFPAAAEGQDLLLFERPDGPVAARFHFPRQMEKDRLCISDWTEPSGQRPDAVALFVTTAGTGIRGRVENLKESGEYLRSHILAATALELAEAAAERLHRHLRTLWGIPDPPEMGVADCFRTRYRGLRVSFGYPACPRLEDQAELFRLLHPEQIGVQLTEGFMMEPEASVSALVFHHPAARYFSVLRVE